MDKMLLAIDVGNSATAFAVYQNRKQKARGWFATVRNRSSDELGVYLYALLAKHQITPTHISDAVLCSVVPTLNPALEQMCRSGFGANTLWAEELLQNHSVPPQISNVAEAGSDRKVNAFAVAKFYQAPAIVVDFGTATTCDLVKAGGAYGGGVIAAGVELGIEALHHKASRLPFINITPPKKVVGTTTLEAMRSGIFWGHCLMIEGLIAKIRQEERLAKNCEVIATGGFAEMFAPHIAAIGKVDMDLTLKGLAGLFEATLNG